MQVDCAGPMNLIAGLSFSLVSISRSRPWKTPGASWKASRASAVGGELGVEDRRFAQHRDPGALRRVERRRGFGERFGAGLEGDEEAFGVVQEGAQDRQVGVRRVEGLAGPWRSFPGCRAARRGRRRRRSVEGDEEVGVDLRDRGDRRVERLQRPPEAGEVGRGATRLRSGASRFRPVCAGCRRRRSAPARGRRGRCRSRPRSGGSRGGFFRRRCRRTGRCRPVRAWRRRAGSFRPPRSPSRSCRGRSAGT